MAKTHGKSGALYYPAGYLKDITISLTATPNKRILDSGNRIITSGFLDGQKVVMTGAAKEENNRVFTITGSPAAGYMTVVETPTAESAGNLITVVVAAPGTVAGGFFNWEMDTSGNPADVTDFQDAGTKSFIPGDAEWKLTAERFFLTTDTTANSPDAWLNNVKFLRFFTKYVGSPTGGNPAYYYEGTAMLNSYKPLTSKGDVIKVSLEFQGIGAIPTLITRTTSWS